MLILLLASLFSGPLVTRDPSNGRYTLIGVSSWGGSGDSCTKDFPSVFARQEKPFCFLVPFFHFRNLIQGNPCIGVDRRPYWRTLQCLKRVIGDISKPFELIEVNVFGQ